MIKEPVLNALPLSYREDLYREASPMRPASRLLPAASSPPPWRVRIPVSPLPVHNLCP